MMQEGGKLMGPIGQSVEVFQLLTEVDAIAKQILFGAPVQHDMDECFDLLHHLAFQAAIPKSRFVSDMDFQAGLVASQCFADLLQFGAVLGSSRPLRTFNDLA
jgi:hypothetical protein